MSQIPEEYRAPLGALVNLLAAADNQMRSQAEKSLHSEWVKKGKVEIMLLYLAERSSGVGEAVDEVQRLFAAVLFRRILTRMPDGPGFSVTLRVIDHIEPAVKEQIRLVLGQGFMAGGLSRSVRHKIADAISECAKSASESASDWPQLLPMLFEATKSGDSSFRESLFRVFGSTPELIDRSLIDNVLPVFHAGFEDSDDDVRIAAATAFVACFQQLPKKLWAQLSVLLPSLLNSLPRLLDNGKDDLLLSVLESLIELVEVAPKMFKPMFGTIIEFCSAVAKNKDLDQNTRLAALELVVSFAESSPNMCKRELSYSESVVVVTLQLMTEVSIDDDELSEWISSEQVDAGDDDEDEPEYELARSALDRVSLKLGGQTLLLPLFQYLLSMCYSDQWRERHAALMLLSSLLEGCRDSLMPETPKILDLILPLLTDPHPRVQYGCCNALGQISTDFADYIQRTAGDRIVPLLVSKLTGDSVPRVQLHAAALLVNFSENASKEVLLPYLDDLLTNLLTLLQGPHRYVQEQVLTTILIIADSAQLTFIKYYDTLMPILISVLKTDMGMENRLLKAKCIECSTLIALAVGKTKFQPHAEDVIQLFGLLQAQLVEDDDPVKLYLQQGWGRICKIVGTDFVPLLPSVLPPLLEAGKLQQDISLLEENEVDEVGADENWEVIQLSGKHIAVHTAVLDDKVTLIELLKTYADVLELQFYEYVGEIAQDIVLPLLDFYLHDGVRGSALLCMPSLLKCAISLGQQQVLLQLWNSIVDKLSDLLLNEPVPELLVLYYSSIISCLELVSAPGVNPLTPQQLVTLATVIESNLVDIYERIKNRENGDDDYAEETEDDDDEFTDEEILDEINKLISAIFKSAKASFVEPFLKLVPTLARYINDENTALKLCGLCVVSDLIEHAGEHSYHFKDLFLQQVGDSLTSPQLSIRQVAAYAVGVALQYGGANYSQFAVATLEPLFKMATVPDLKLEENITATENGVTAIAKICHSYGSSLPNLDQIIDNWFKLLPVLKDDELLPFAYSFLVELINKQHPVVMQQIPKVVDHVVQLLTYSSIGGKTASKVVEATKGLLGTIPQLDLVLLLSKYSAETQVVIQRWFS